MEACQWSTRYQGLPRRLTVNESLTGERFVGEKKKILKPNERYQKGKPGKSPNTRKIRRVLKPSQGKLEKDNPGLKRRTQGEDSDFTQDSQQKNPNKKGVDTENKKALVSKTARTYKGSRRSLSQTGEKDREREGGKASRGGFNHSRIPIKRITGSDLGGGVLEEKGGGTIKRHGKGGRRGKEADS